MSFLNRKLTLEPVIAVIVFHACILRVVYIANYNSYALAMCLPVIAYLLINYRSIPNRFFRFNLFVVGMCCLMLFSSLVNSGYNFRGAFLFALKVLLLFLFLECQCSKNRLFETALIFCALSYLYLILVYLSVCQDSLIAYKNGLNYLVGSKFSVSYLSIFACGMLMFICRQECLSTRFLSKLIMLAGFAFSLFMTSFVHCNTGSIGLTLFGLFCCLRASISRIVYKPSVVLTVALVSALSLLLFSEIITSNEAVRSFITDALNRDPSLSGRTLVYSRVLRYVRGGFLFGYGYNSVYALLGQSIAISSDWFAADAQDALLEYLLYFGIVGLLFLLTLIALVFSSAKRSSDSCRYGSFPFVIAIYVFLMLGSAEITINMYFFAFLAFLNSLTVDNERDGNPGEVNGGGILYGI